MSEQQDWFTDPAVSIWAQPWFRQKMAEKMSEQQAPSRTIVFGGPYEFITPQEWVKISAVLERLRPRPRYPKSENSLHARRRRGRR